MMKIAAAIISGGKSGRIGRDKAAVLLGGKPLIAQKGERDALHRFHLLSC